MAHMMHTHAHTPALLVDVVEHERDASLGHPRLALLVHQLLQVRHADLGQVRDAQHEANRVQDVAFAAAVETRDSVELRVEALENRPRRVRLEPIDDHLLDVHGCCCSLLLAC